MAAPPSPTTEAPQEPLQSVMAIGRQQGWGTAAGTRVTSASLSRRGEKRGSVTVMCPETMNTVPGMSDHAGGNSPGFSATPPRPLSGSPPLQKRLSATPNASAADAAAAAGAAATATPTQADGTPAAVPEVGGTTPPLQATPTASQEGAMRPPLAPSRPGGNGASTEISISAVATGYPTAAAFEDTVQLSATHAPPPPVPFPNTNGLCEALVTAARYNASATAPTMPASVAMGYGPAGGATRDSDSAKLYPASAAAAMGAAAGADGRGARGPQAGGAEQTRLSVSVPFGSYSASEDPLQTPHRATPQLLPKPQTSSVPFDSTSAMGITAGSGGESASTGGVLAVAGQQALTAVAPTGAASAGTVAVPPPAPGGAEMQRMLAEARQAYTTAEKRLLDDGLALCEDWMRTRDLFFAAGSLFAVVGDTATAARCLLHATFINRAFHNEEEALTTLSMSVEQLKLAHPRIAVDSLLRLAPCYEKRELRFQAARCYREAAEMLENVLEEKEEAIIKYRAALDMYSETKVAAAATARQWEREQRHMLEKAKEKSAPLPAVTGPPAASADASTAEPHSARATPGLITGPASATAADTEADGAPGSGSDPAGAALVPLNASLSTTPSMLTASATSMTTGGQRLHTGFGPHGPPQYRVSTTVQRTLADACRWRLAVLLTRLGRYEEVRETMLGYAASVPRNLPRTKYLLYATLCVLARGAAKPVEEGAAAATAKAEAPRASLAFAPSPEAEAADAVYFDSLYDGEKFFLALQDEDRTLQRGKENALVRAMLAANRACSLTAFDEAVRTYRAYSTTEPCIVFDLLAAECRRSLFEHVERFS